MNRNWLVTCKLTVRHMQMTSGGRGRRWKWMARSRPRAAECHCADHRCRSEHSAVRPQRPCLLLVCRSTHVRLFLPGLPNNVPTSNKKKTTIASLFFWQEEISTPKERQTFACRFRTCPGHNFRLLLTNISLAFKARNFWFSHNLTSPSRSNLIHLSKFAFHCGTTFRLKSKFDGYS